MSDAERVGAWQHEREVWRSVYISAAREGIKSFPFDRFAAEAAKVADEALRVYRERLPPSRGNDEAKA